MQNLENSLRLGVTCPVYLFYGEESLLMEQAVARIAAVVAPGENVWNKEFYQGDEVDVFTVLESAQSGAFFAEKKLVVVRNVTWFKPKRKKEPEGAAGEENESNQEQLQPLLDYLKDPNPTTVLVLLVEGSVNKNSRVVKAVTEQGRVVEFISPKGGARELWLKKYLHAAGKVPGEGVISYLSLMCAEDLHSLKTEADKLLLYCAGISEISLADAEAIVSRSALAGVFELTDSVTAGDAAIAVAVYRRLLRQNEAPQMLLGMLGSQYRNILAAKDMSQRGFSAPQIASELHISPFYAKKCLAQSRRYGFRPLLKALEILLSVDIDGKSGKGDTAELLELAILRICLL